MPNVLPMFQTLRGPTGGEESNPRALWRFRVTELITDAPGGATLVKARPYSGPELAFDATLQGPRDYIIKVNAGKSVGGVFYATKPEGGCDAKYGTPNKPVVWMETTGGISVGWCKAIADWAPNAAPPDDYSIQVNPCDATGIVPAGAVPFRVYLTGNLSRRTHYAAIKANDILAYLPIANNAGVTGILISLPIVGGALYSLMQATGTNAVGFDFLRVS